MSFRLSAENLGKWYEIRPQSGFSGTWYQTLAACSKRVGLRLPSYRAGDGIWALKDVSFQVAQGEVLGVIGPNGAGKTTLLRLLSKVTPPTEGRVSGRGRVVSLLELGMGFQPDLPGLENIYLNAAMHDISRAEVERCLDAIIAFSELERFIHTPVKHYSSGMYLRLAFAIATNLEAEILLADEVLAVGDISFQERCIKRVRESAEAGTSVLFVSHDMAAIRRLCSRALWLDRGEVVALGDTEEVVSRYERGALGIERTAKAGSERTSGKAGGETDQRSNNWVDFIGTELVSETGEPIGALLNTQPVRMRFALNIKKEGVPVRCAVVLTTETHPPIHLFRIVQPVDVMPQGRGLCHVTAIVPGNILNAGSFTAKCAVTVEVDGELHVLSRDRGLRFSVMRPLETSPTEDRLAGLPDTGVMAPPVTWACVRPELPVKEGSQ